MLELEAEVHPTVNSRGLLSNCEIFGNVGVTFVAGCRSGWPVPVASGRGDSG